MVAISTGLPALDAALGGGMPQGLVHVHGEVEQIQRVRDQMSLVPEGKSYHVVGSPPPIEKFVNQVVMQVRAVAGTYPNGLILDVGDVTQTLEGREGAEGVIGLLRDHAIANIKPTCLLMETHSMYDEFMRVADVVLYADPGRFGDKSTKVWVVEKGPVNEGLRFDPLATAPNVTLAPPNAHVSAQRVVAALRRDPALAWNVARSLRILGPWQRSASGGWERMTPEGVCGAMIGVTVADDRTEHVFFRHEGKEKRVPLTARTTEVVKAEADGLLRRYDFLLWDEVTP